MTDTAQDPRSIAYVRVEHKFSHPESYDYTVASTSIPVDVTDLGEAELVDALQHATNMVKVVVFDALGVEHSYVDGVVTPKVVPAAPVKRTETAGGSYSRRPTSRNLQAVDDAFPKADKFTFKDADSGKPIDWEPTEAEVEDLRRKGMVGKTIYVNQAALKPGSRRPLYTTSIRDGDGAVWPKGR